MAIAKLKKRGSGVYEEFLRAKVQQSKYKTDIDKDLARTFPEHPYFMVKHHGIQGYKALRNILLVYSVYDEKVGYCQSMNFVVGFIMLINGGNEEEAFWLFAALAGFGRNKDIEPKFESIRGLYKEGFRLLNQYYYQFNKLFCIKLNSLYNHFQNEGIPESLWL